MAGENRRAAIAVAVAWYVILLVTPHVAGARTICLTPAAEEALRTLVTTGRLSASLGPSLTFKGMNLSADEIVLQTEDTRGQSQAISLGLGSQDRSADGHGKRFAFHLAPSNAPTDPAITKALLASASLIDGAVPEAALGPCSGAPGGTAAGGLPNQGARAMALFSAIVQVAILVAATIFGWRALRSA